MKWPAPTMVLLASWGNLSPRLCADLMVYDAANHPDPKRFDEWANGGECPYSGVAVQRAAMFQEDREVWLKGIGSPCSAFALVQRVLIEKCPAWSEEKRSAFVATFGKKEKHEG